MSFESVMDNRTPVFAGEAEVDRSTSPILSDVGTHRCRFTNFPVGQSVGVFDGAKVDAVID